MEPLLIWTGIGVASITLAWLFADNRTEEAGPPDITGEWIAVNPKEAKAPQVAGPVMRGMIVGLMLSSVDGESVAIVEAIVTDVQDETVNVLVRKLYDGYGRATPPVPAIIRNVLKGDLLKAAES